ncbi:hypothetical protein [Salinirubrum litoreum]|uniref:DUF7979 domain-containing protein n=1 Tax=Salinirubrum litoreum TaxID=1126234 RepID=A0ABD5REA4_9EURY|nr:hypothetical protein [Salinirubrum litoreum]
MDRRLATLVVLLVAVPLVAAPLVAFPTADQPTYVHDIEQIDEREIPADVTVQQYDDLSPEARQAIDSALASDDGTAVVRGEANEPPEFAYSDTTFWGDGRYAVEKNGEHYELTTYAAGGIDVSPITERLLQLLGLFVGVAGIVGVHDGRERTATAVAGVAAVPLFGTVIHSVGLAEVDALVLFSALGAFCVAVAGVGVVTPRPVGVAVTGLFTVGVVAVAVVFGLGLFVVGPVLLVALVGLLAAVFTNDSAQTTG